MTENVFVTTSRQFLRCLVSTYGDKCIKISYIMASYLLSLGRLCNAVLVRFEEMNDDLGICVRLSISPSTDDALFRSQHLKDQVSELSTARFFSIIWKALLPNCSSRLRRQQLNGLSPKCRKAGTDKANPTFGA